MKIFHSYFYRIHFNTQTLVQARGEEQDQRPLPRVPPHPGGLHHLLHRPPHGDRVAAHHPVGGGKFPL